MNACWKLDAGGQVSGPVAVWEASLERQFRAVRTEPIGRRRSGLSEVCGVGASQPEAVLVPTGEATRRIACGSDKGACGQDTGLSGADNAHEGCCSHVEHPQEAVH